MDARPLLLLCVAAVCGARALIALARLAATAGSRRALAETLDDVAALTLYGVASGVAIALLT